MPLGGTVYADADGPPPWAPAGDQSGHGRPACRVLTIGTFDILHYGHIAFLQQAARLGTELLVGVNTDRFVRVFKPPPVMCEAERVHALRQLGYRTWLNDGPGRDLIEALGPDVLAVGSDWARKDYLAQIGVDQDWLDGRKIILAYVPYVQAMPISTSEIRRRVREQAAVAAGDMEAAHP